MKNYFSFFSLIPAVFSILQICFAESYSAVYKKPPEWMLQPAVKEGY